MTTTAAWLATASVGVGAMAYLYGTLALRARRLRRADREDAGQ